VTQRGGPPNAAPSTVTSEQVPVLAATEALKAAETRARHLVSEHADAVKQAKAIAQSHRRLAKRNAAPVKALARQGLARQPVTEAQIRELGRQLGPELELARESALAQRRVQALAQALADAEQDMQARAQDLALLQEQALVLAQARAAELERPETPIVRVMAFFRLVWHLVRTPTSLRSKLVHSLLVSMGVVGLGIRLLPSTARARYEQEWYGDLEELQREKAPLLGVAIRIVVRAPWMAVILRASAWRRSPAMRWVASLEPLWVGLGWATATFLAGAAGLSTGSQPPTDQQLRLLAGASLLTGGLTAWTERKRRRKVRRRKR
jgi:hypothetical protein